MSEPRYLCIHKHDGANDPFVPWRASVSVCHPRGAGTVAALPEHEVPKYAAWCAEHGGRDLLDAFELAAINARLLRLEPDVESLDGLEGDVEWTALEFQHGPDRIVWRPAVKCERCEGLGEFDDPLGGHECPDCDGCGRTYGAKVITDYDGNVVEED